MRSVLGSLTGMAVALICLAALCVSPAIEWFFPTLQVAVPASLAVAALGALWAGLRPPSDLADGRAQEWRRAVALFFPLGLAIGCLAAGLGILVLIMIFFEL